MKNDLFYKCSNYPDILAFSETKLNQETSIPTLEGYSFEYMNSPSSYGGVGVYLSNSLSYSKKHDLQLDIPGCEDIWIQIDLNAKSSKSDKSLVLGVIYRHPSSKYEYFSEKLCNQLLMLNQRKMKYIIVGDFNIDLNKYNISSSVTNYLNALSSSGSNVFIDKPTRITSHGATCIDHVYSNYFCNQLDNYILQGGVSDHCGTLTRIENIVVKRDIPIKFYRKTNLTDLE